VLKFLCTCAPAYEDDDTVFEEKEGDEKPTIPTVL